MKKRKKIQFRVIGLGTEIWTQDFWILGTSPWKLDQCVALLVH
jgi:hypothetical protein